MLLLAYILRSRAGTHLKKVPCAVSRDFFFFRSVVHVWTSKPHALWFGFMNPVLINPAAAVGAHALQHASAMHSHYSVTWRTGTS